MDTHAMSTIVNLNSLPLKCIRGGHLDPTFCFSRLLLKRVKKSPSFFVIA